jgi:hypothetical protein
MAVAAPKVEVRVLWGDAGGRTSATSGCRRLGGSGGPTVVVPS